MKTLLIQIDDLDSEVHAVSLTPNLDTYKVTWTDKTEQFVASPNCSNFRAKVETGLYTIRPENDIGGIFTSDDTQSMSAGPHLLGKRLQAAGYTTAQIGKWHLCSHNDWDHRTSCGYDYYNGSQANLNPNGYFAWATSNNGTPQPVEEYATDHTTREACGVIAQGYGFVNVCYNAIHKPFHAPPGMPSGPEYMLEYLDRAIGTLVQLAKSQGYAIIITSDNGGYSETGGKGNLSHKALATILFCWGFPVYSRIIDTTDIHATVFHLVTGYPISRYHPKTDGVSMCDRNNQRKIAFADKWNTVMTGPGPNRREMATDGILKVIRKHGNGQEIYTDWFDSFETSNPVRHRHLIDALDNR